MTSRAPSQSWPVWASTSDDDARVDEASMASFPASEPTPSRNGVWKVLLEWLGAAALVPLLVLALVAAGTALVLVVRLIINIVSWVIGSIS